MAKIGVKQCCCGYKNCQDYWLTGIGKFMQGSGFDKEDAERIAALLNQDEANRERSLKEVGFS